MARIRTIKPEFFTSEDIVALSPMARLLYVALWCEADKAGRMQWRPKTFKMRYFPADGCDIDAMCAELIAAGLVVLYGDGLAYVPCFSKHQHINPRETNSTLPNPDASARVEHASARVQQQSVTHREEGKGREGDICTEFLSDSVPDPVATPVILIPLVDGSDHGIPSSQVAEWSSSYPAVNVLQQLRQMREWCKAKPSRRKTKRGVQAFVVGWLSRAQDRGGVGLPESEGADRFAGAI